MAEPTGIIKVGGHTLGLTLVIWKEACLATQQDQIRAEVERVSYRNEDNGWSVLRARAFDRDNTFTVTGHFGTVHAGEQYELIGAWTKHPQYGRQFKVDRSVPLRPSTQAAIERYLSSGLIKGIGPKTAQRIAAHFGDRTLDTLDENPRLLLQVPGIGRKKAKQIIASWEDQRAVADVMMFLNSHGVSPAYATKIYKAYGPEAIEIVSADPYRLATDIHGIGFLSADKIAQSVGIAADSRERVRAAVIYQLQQGEDRGHCYLTRPQLIDMLQGGLGLDQLVVEERLADVLQDLENAGAVIREQLRGSNGHDQTAFYRADILAAECSISAVAERLLNTPFDTDLDRVESWLQRYTQAAGTELSEEQLAAVRQAARQRFFILTGGPGVGKTTTANTIIRLLRAMGKSVALAAPTGRAAQRLSEVAGTEAKTIHRLLEWTPNIGTFAKDEADPLAVQAVIVDEASMLDVRLADALLRAVPETAQVILIGDVDQLPSVGPGNVLRDLIQSDRIPFTRLSQIFRQAQASKIVQSAHAINQGQAPSLDSSSDHDCRLLRADTAAELKDQIINLVAGSACRDHGFHPTRDTQILTPMNRGDLGTITLNNELQELLNPPRPNLRELKKGSLVLRPGDKVIQNANNYDLGVFNGDIGFVRDVGGKAKLLVEFAGRTVAYDDEAIGDLRLAYAITIHKSQGSEFPFVIIPVAMQHYVMLQRNLIYTALTRAKKLAVFVGAKKALSYAVSNQDSLRRQTYLATRLRDIQIDS